MKVSKNKDKIVSVRLNLDDFSKLQDFAKYSGLKTPSAVIRMYVNAIVVQVDEQRKKGLFSSENK